MTSRVSWTPPKLLTCSVCLARADGSHFGIISCRACAAFFRRTVSLQLVYNCRNNSDCQIEKGHRNMCRYCRYFKCKSEGMNDNGVQLLRDSIGRKQNVRVEPPPVQDAPQVLAGTSNDSDDVQYMENPSSELLQEIPMIGEGSHSHILPQMCKGYAQFLMIRGATHTLLNNDTFSQMFQPDKKEMRASNFDAAKRVSQLEAHLITDIVSKFFLPFNDLCLDDKMMLFKNFFCFFSHTDRAYQSYKKFKNDKDNDKMLMPDGGYIKRSELVKYYENAKGVHSSPEDAAKIFLPVLDYILNVIIDHMRRIEMNETEYVAILGFCLWDNAVVGVTKTTKDIVYKAQNIILNDLQSFYAQSKLRSGDTANRIGQLMLLIPKLTKCVIMLRESSVLAELFNFYEPDVCCKNLKEESVTCEAARQSCGSVQPEQ